MPEGSPKMGPMIAQANLIRRAYAEDLEGLTPGECRVIGFTEPQCAALVGAMGLGAAGAITPGERTQLEQAGFAAAFIDALAGADGKEALRNRGRWFASQPLDFLRDEIIKAEAVYALVAANAEAALDKLYGREEVLALGAALRDPNASVRREAATVLGGICGPVSVCEDVDDEVAPALIAALLDKDAGVRGEAAMALGRRNYWLYGRVSRTWAVSALEATLRDPQTEVRAKTAEALGHWAPYLSEESWSALTTALKDPDTGMRAAAAGTLGGILSLPYRSGGGWSDVGWDEEDEWPQISDEAVLAVPALSTTLKDPDAGVRAAAAGALGDIYSSSVNRPMPKAILNYVPQVVPALLAALRDPEANVRHEATYALGLIESPQAVPALIAAMQDPEAQVRSTAVWALGQTKAPQVIPRLIDALQGPDAALRGPAAWALMHMYSRDGAPPRAIHQYIPQVVPALVAALKDENPSARKGAIEALEEIKAPETLPAMIATLADPYKDVRSVAYNALWAMNAPQVILALIAALQNENAAVRRNAVVLLRDKKARQAEPALIAALQDRDAEVRKAAAAALRAIAPGGLSALLASLQDENPQVRLKAIGALGKIKSPHVVPALIAALKDQDAAVSETAGLILSKIGDPKIIPALLAVLKDDTMQGNASPEVFAKALVTVCVVIGPQKSMAILVATLQNPDAWMRLWAAVSLFHLYKDPRAVPPLIAALVEQDPRIRGVAAAVLGNTGDRRAVSPLLATLRDAEWEVREAAANALGNIAGRVDTAVLSRLKTMAEEDPAPECRQAAKDAWAKIISR
ncbi:MAG: HEAT repeat domain-containing protein [Deltaproteobacteria bacterium]|nr:HEAT repeat domain-containing protein [Deltaproteobacteria bacterium]